MNNYLGPWSPATTHEVATLFAMFDNPWWIAGGIAIELAAGQTIRSHGDVDVLVLRPHTPGLRKVLSGWDLWVADPPGTGTLRPWPVREPLAGHVHDIWCRPNPQTSWRIQVMIDEADGGIWISRRNPMLRRSWTDLGKTSNDGLPFLAPEVQLYYKAANVRPKDQQDFDAILPHLDTYQRRWLDEAIATISTEHPWRKTLNAEPPGRQA